jgi:acyl dehydratase
MKRPLVFEDVEPGQVEELGSHRFTREEILEFGRRYDPQPFHVDEEAARASPFGGLVASGWHTSVVCMRLLVEALLGPGSGSLGSPGVDEIRWLQPVRPDDLLTVSAQVVEKVPSRSRPDRGVVRVRTVARNQRGEEVLTMVGLGLVRRRGAPGSEPTEPAVTR